MTTERDLDIRLQSARGLQEHDLPALSEAFLEHLHGSRDASPIETGTRPALAPVDQPASVLAARQLVDDARQRREVAARRRRRPRRRTVLRVGAALTAVAAAVISAVVVTTSHGDRTATAAPTPSPRQTQTGTGTAPSQGAIDPPGGLTLVAAQAITFPYSLDPAPKGLTPEFGLSGAVSPFGSQPNSWGVSYRSADDPGFTFDISTADPRHASVRQRPQDAHASDHLVQSGTVPVGDAKADFDRYNLRSQECQYVPSTPEQAKEPGKVCSDTLTELFWQRADGQWVYLWGKGDTYSQVAELASVGASIVDRPQPVPLQVGLSPQGWSVSSYDSTGGLTLISDTDPSMSNRISVDVQERWRGYRTPDDVLQGMTDGNPVDQVTVHGRPAELVSVPDHFADNRRMWYLAAQLPGGPVFLLQAPDTLSKEDVLAIAHQVTYKP
jgi:hypothetical protein